MVVKLQRWHTLIFRGLAYRNDQASFGRYEENAAGPLQLNNLIHYLAKVFLAFE